MSARDFYDFVHVKECNDLFSKNAKKRRYILVDTDKRNIPISLSAFNAKSITIKWYGLDNCNSIYFHALNIFLVKRLWKIFSVLFFIKECNLYYKIDLKLSRISYNRVVFIMIFQLKSLWHCASRWSTCYLAVIFSQ